MFSPLLFMLGLALSLLVLRIFTDDHHVAVTLDNLALFADLFYRRLYFHVKYHLSLLYAVYFDRHVILPFVGS